jgi:hypothetical protein
MNQDYRIIEKKNPLTDDKYYMIQSKFLWVWLTIRRYGLYANAEDAEKFIIKLHPKSNSVVKTFAFTKIQDPRRRERREP